MTPHDFRLVVWCCYLLTGTTWVCFGWFVMPDKRYPPEYWVWCSMRRRCYSPKSGDYYLYGARGVQVCDRWRESFANFMLDMGPRPTSGHTIERKDGAGHYCPENCRWATRAEQCQNTRTCRWITHNGITLNISQWANRLGIPSGVLRSRLHRGWSESSALTEPVLSDLASKQAAMRNASAHRWLKSVPPVGVKVNTKSQHG